jgi:hypothetical protein
MARSKSRASGEMALLKVEGKKAKLVDGVIGVICG